MPLIFHSPTPTPKYTKGLGPRLVGVAGTVGEITVKRNGGLAGQKQTCHVSRAALSAPHAGRFLGRFVSESEMLQYKGSQRSQRCDPSNRRHIRRQASVLHLYKNHSPS